MIIIIVVTAFSHHRKISKTRQELNSLLLQLADRNAASQIIICSKHSD